MKRAHVFAQATADALEAHKQGTPSDGTLSANERHSLEKRNQLKKILASVLVAVFILVATGVTVLLTWERTLPVYSATDFDDIPGLEDVIVRPPEILIVVNANVWEALTAEEKRHAVKQISETVGPAGYRLAEFRTLQTPGLAFWTKDGTIKISD